MMKHLLARAAGEGGGGCRKEYSKLRDKYSKSSSMKGTLKYKSHFSGIKGQMCMTMRTASTLNTSHFPEHKHACPWDCEACACATDDLSVFLFNSLRGGAKASLLTMCIEESETRQGRRKGNIRTRPTVLLLSSYLATTLTRPLGQASSTRDTEERLSKSHQR